MWSSGLCNWGGGAVFFARSSGAHSWLSASGGGGACNPFNSPHCHCLTPAAFSAPVALSMELVKSLFHQAESAFKAPVLLWQSSEVSCPGPSGEGSSLLHQHLALRGGKATGLWARPPGITLQNQLTKGSHHHLPRKPLVWQAELQTCGSRRRGSCAGVSLDHWWGLLEQQGPSGLVGLRLWREVLSLSSPPWHGGGGHAHRAPVCWACMARNGGWLAGRSPKEAAG